MSSDPFADLANTAEAFAREFREVLSRNQRPAPGSPADKEADGEPYAGDWGDYPSRDIFPATYLAVTSCTDHLLGLSDVVRARNAVFASYTLTRGAVEAAAIGCYLTDPGIDGRERLRRTTNYRLLGMCEQVRLFQDLRTSDAADKLDQAKRRIADFARSARKHGFTFRDMDSRGHSACLDKPQPSAMELISRAVDKDVPELGRTYQRLLSATAHSVIHGLARMLAPVEPDDADGWVLAAVNRDPRSLATELIVAPLTAFNLAKGVEWFCGCDMTSLHSSANVMLSTWSRVDQMGIPGLPS
jgi:hypothetical protein